MPIKDTFRRYKSQKSPLMNNLLVSNDFVLLVVQFTSLKDDESV